MSYSLRIAPDAEAQLTEIDDWWHRYRTSAPNLFRDELESAISQLLRSPLLGRQWPIRGAPNVRRVLLQRTRYYLYYQLEFDWINVVAVWHSRRGSEPKL